jgi:hypothetical protein
LASCPLCRQRKGKRTCPAKGAEICSHCCGTKRRVEIACPEDCVWLGGHAAAWDGRETEHARDIRRLAPHLQGLTEGQARLFFLALVGLTGLRARYPELGDHLLHEAVAALRKTVETRERGILYEHPAEDLRAQGLVPEIRAIFETRDEAGTTHAADDRDILAVLQSLQKAIEECRHEQAGPAAFLETAGRIAGRAAGPRPPARPLIVQP